MVNLRGRPRAWPCSRSTRAQKAWKVPTVISFAAGPASAATRSRISPAALLVKVTARMLAGSTPRESEVRDARGDHARLARAGAGQDEQRALGGRRPPRAATGSAPASSAASPWRARTWVVEGGAGSAKGAVVITRGADGSGPLRRPPRSARPSASTSARRNGGIGREGSRTKRPSSSRTAPMKTSSRHFSSGIENPSSVITTSSKGCGFPAISGGPAAALDHLARHVLEQAHLLRGEVRALEQRPPLRRRSRRCSPAAARRWRAGLRGAGPAWPRGRRGSRARGAPTGRSEGRNTSYAATITACERLSEGWSGCDGISARRPQRASSSRVSPDVSPPKTRAARSPGAMAATSSAASRTSRVGCSRSRFPLNAITVCAPATAAARSSNTCACSSTSWAPQAVRQHSTVRQSPGATRDNPSRPVLRIVRATAPTLAGTSGRTRTTRTERRGMATTCPPSPGG